MILKRRQDFEGFLKAPPRDCCAALVFGQDRALVRERAEAMARAATPDLNDPFTVAVLSEGQLDTEGETLERELSAGSMMGGRRLVWLRLTGERPTGQKLAGEALSGHLDGRFNPEAFFLIEASALEASSTLRKLAEKSARAAALPCYEDERGDTVRMIRESLTADRVGLTAPALELFVDRLPKERGILRQEVEKLILWLGPGSGTQGDLEAIEALMGVEPLGTLAEAAVSAFGGHLPEAHRSLKRAFSSGEGGVAALRALSSHLMRLRRALIVAQSGKSMQEAAKSVGIFWKSEREFLRQANAWGTEALLAVQAEIYAADRQCRTTGSPDQLLAERMVLTVAGRAKRLGL